MNHSRHHITKTKCFVHLLCLITIMAALFSLCSCTQSSTVPQKNDAENSVVFCDSCNREVKVPANIQKVVVAGAPSQNFLLTFAPDKMIELSTELTQEQKEVFGERIANLPVMGQLYGTKGTINKESIASLDADVIIDIGVPKNSIVDDMNKLQEQTGIPCVHIDATIDTYPNAYIMLGNLLNMQDKAKTLANYCSNKYYEIKSLLESCAKTNALWVGDPEATTVIAKGSPHSDVIDMCTNNVAVIENEAAKGSGNNVSVEQISIWNPDVIFVDYTSTKDKIMSEPQWSGINAVKNNKVYVVPTFPYNWIGQPPSTMQILGMQ